MNTQKRLAITIPLHTLMVLCGPAGSGKSTFAQTFVERHLEQGVRPSVIVSSDACRVLVCDDEAMSTIETTEQRQVQRDTFELFYSLLAKRLKHGRLSIADTLSLDENVRRGMLELARRFNYQSCLIVFHLSLETCLLGGLKPCVDLLC